MRKLLLLLSIVTVVAKAAIITPYPDTFQLKQINGAEKERLRLAQGHKKYDKQPTGFYAEAGKPIEVNVEIVTAADKDVMPVLTVGTLGFNPESRSTGKSFTLKAGLNTITDHSGGLIWLSFVQNEAAAPKGVVSISFTSASQHVRAPHYVYGVTTDVEFYEMYSTYKTPDVLFTSDYVAVAATRDAATLYSLFNTQGAKLKEWMEAIHVLLEKEDEISGLDNNDPNPLHHRFNKGEIRYLLVENTSESPHANSVGYTGYPKGSRNRYLTKIGLPGNNSWMLGHEIGHQHQQPAYLINKATESTVNIYSYVVERNIVGTTYSRTTAQRWKQAQDSYLKLPVSKRIYDMDDKALEAIVGFNRDELRFMVWEQLFLIFGDQFYKTLHRVAREEKVVEGNADERRAYLIWKSSQISGYDLTDYFNLWGIRVSDSTIKAKLRARIAHALSNANIIALPRPAEDYVLVTGHNVPEWAKLSLRGITSSAPSTEIFDTSAWTVETSFNGAADTMIGGDKPSYIIDGYNETAFAFVKPGKSLNGVTPPTDYIPAFVVDMKRENTFNSATYTHRTSNSSNYLRARQLSISGSSDNVNFTPIVKNYVVDYAKNDNVLNFTFETVKYRYVKVEIEDWDKTNGNSIQVSEFGLSNMLVENLPVPDQIKYKVNVEAGDGIVCSQNGVSLANEDSDIIVNFGLADNYVDELKVLVDGDLVTPMQNGDNYSIKVKVVNHVNIQISARTNTGIQSVEADGDIVSPNPVKAGQEFEVRVNDVEGQSVVSIYNMAGAKVNEQRIENGKITAIIPAPGVYFVSTLQGNLRSTLKLIVK